MAKHVYSIHEAEDGSVALAGPDGEHITYKSNWGDLIYWFREAHWPEHPAHQDNEPATTTSKWNLPNIARRKG